MVLPARGTPFSAASFKDPRPFGAISSRHRHRSLAGLGNRRPPHAERDEEENGVHPRRYAICWVMVFLYRMKSGETAGWPGETAWAHCLINNTDNIPYADDRPRSRADTQIEFLAWRSLVIDLVCVDRKSTTTAVGCTGDCRARTRANVDAVCRTADPAIAPGELTQCRPELEREALIRKVRAPVADDRRGSASGGLVLNDSLL